MDSGNQVPGKEVKVSAVTQYEFREGEWTGRERESYSEH